MEVGKRNVKVVAKMKTSAGLKYNNYIGKIHVKNLLKNLPQLDVSKVKNVDVNGQKRGCRGFIINNDTGKVCYVDTEPFFNFGSGSGLYGDINRAVMMRTAKHDKDYTGGINQWLSVEKIPEMAIKLTTDGSETYTKWRA